MNTPLPGTSTFSNPATGSPTPPAAGWAVGAGRGTAWWGDAWRLFTASPGIWLVITLLYLAITIGLGIIPFIGQVANTLLQPVLMAGIVLACRAQDRGGELTVSHLFAGFNEKLGPLVVVGLIYFAGGLAIVIVAIAIAVAVVGTGTLGALLAGGDALQTGLAFVSTIGVGMLLALLVAALLIVPLLMALWFAPALIVFRGDEPFAAMGTSFSACLRNIPPFLVYSIVGLAFAILACIPVFLGLFVFAPVCAATLYTTYKDIFGTPA